ncbi:MAG: hypothetical protein J0H44_02315 [Alphaproteobacteria bacterium]|nr:hypothetical protein [Alphaproteobacteria bacterium]
MPTRLMMDEQRKLSVLKLFLRIYGALSFLIFVPLCLAIMLQNPLFDDGGLMNWTIWNGVICGGQPCYVPPMLFIIYLVWAAFLFLAARDPYRYRSFLTFTAWANLFHGLLMSVQAATDLGLFWSKYFTDIPFVTILALGIFILLPKRDGARTATA